MPSTSRAPWHRWCPSGYARIESDADIVIERRATAMNEAVWFGLTTAGFDSEIAEFTSDRLRISARAG